MWRWFGAAVAAAMLTAGVGLGALPVEAKGACVPRPGSEACLSYLFADNGAHFSTKVWQADILKAEGTTPSLAAKFERLIRRAKTQAEKTKIDQWFEKTIRGSPTSAVFPSWPTANRVCKKLVTTAGWKYHVGSCQFWYDNFGVVTGWQLQEGNGESVIQVYGYTPRSHLTPGPDLATLQFPGDTKMPDTAAWTAQDSPLPLIAWFNIERRQRFDSGMLHLQSDQGGTVGDNESISAAQFLAFWGYGYVPLFWSNELRALMKDAGFNPIMAGGPNEPPGAGLAPFTSRVLDASVLRAAGWDYTAWPEVALAPIGFPIIYATGVH